MRLRNLIGILLAALLLMPVSCTEMADTPKEVDPVEELLAGKEMPVRIGFDLPGTSGVTPLTKASIVGGDESHPNFVTHLAMLCFTVEGIYLGYRVAELKDNEKQFDGTHNNCWGRELFEGTVPARTSRIHFVANARNHVPGFERIGDMENVLLKSAVMSLSKDENRSITYWGFHGETSPDALKAWLADVDPDSGKPVKKVGSIVHLIRDRARVELDEMNDIPSKSHNPYKILQIDWIISNGLNQGFLAPFNSANPTDAFSGYIDEATLVPDKNRLTPYNLPDASRYTADDESEMVTVYKDENNDWENDITDDTTDPNKMLYLFEDNNDPNNPPKLIVKVRYREDATNPSSREIVKYHTLMLMDVSNQPVKVLRNHTIRVDITSMPWEGMGHSTFAAAVASTDYENNRTVLIEDVVDDVNDGKYELSIVGGTSKIYHEGTNTEQLIEFEFKALSSDVSISDVVVDDFTAGWQQTPDATFARPEVTVTDFNTTTGKGHIKITLGTTINSELQSGTIELQHTESNLSRRIHIYTITEFNFVPTGGLILRRTGNSRTVSGQTCQEYSLQIRIPGNYPAGLYPIVIRVASTTLSPIRCVSEDGLEATASVTMLPTENGQIVDGEVLAGMTFTTTANKWNTRENGKPWDFWYNSTILSKPLKADGTEDNAAKIYTIYFDDVRPLKAAANRADNIGLFLKIKHFGDAIPVEYE